MNYDLGSNIYDDIVIRTTLLFSDINQLVLVIRYNSIVLRQDFNKMDAN